MKSKKQYMTVRYKIRGLNLQHTLLASSPQNACRKVWRIWLKEKKVKGNCNFKCLEVEIQ